MNAQTAIATPNPNHFTSADENTDMQAVRDMLEQWRRRHIEPVWAQLNQYDQARFSALWQALSETGLCSAALPEADGGIPLDSASIHAALQQLGAACPALAAALVSHLCAQTLLREAGAGSWPAGISAGESLALIGSPLDAKPVSRFSLERRNGVWHLDGTQRAIFPPETCLVLPANHAGGLHLCVLRSDAHGIAFTPTPSSHGLCLLPFGELRANNAVIDDAQVFAWPASGHAANLADGLITALVGGMLDELASRAGDYARERVQAGKPICEHHAVQHLLGSIELARTPVHALAVATLAQEKCGDGSASAFAIALLRRAALDAIQVFGGYGYMEDYRVERYLRDANTLETFWVHAAQRERALVMARGAARARGEAA